MRQIVYTSTSTAPEGKADLAGILEQSRHNNALDGVTGLLWSDGVHIVQAIEGPEVSVEETFARIRTDPRHRDVTVHRDATVEGREFGDWTLAYRSMHETIDAHDVRIHRLLGDASPDVSGPFLALMAFDPSMNGQSNGAGAASMANR